MSSSARKTSKKTKSVHPKGKNTLITRQLSDARKFGFLEIKTKGKAKSMRVSKEKFLYEMAVNKKVFPTTWQREVSKEQRKELVDGLFELMGRALCNGAEVFITGIGTLKVVEKSKTKRKHPTTGNWVNLPAHKSVTLFITDTFKKELNRRKS